MNKVQDKPSAVGVAGCSGGCDDKFQTLVPKRCVLERQSPTPAQASNRMQRAGTYGDWVNDVPVQGPTNPDMRAFGCYWKNNVLDKVTDYQGAVVPRWTQHSLCIGNRLVESGIGNASEIRRAGVRVGALSADPAAPPAGASATTTAPAPSAQTPATTQAAAPPGIWSKLSDSESHWIAATLIQLNTLIVKAGNKPCTTWPADLLQDSPTAVFRMPEAVACFQSWFNTNSKPSHALRTDGNLNDATLCALLAVTQQHAADFPTPYPGRPPCGLSMLVKVGIGASVAAVVGGTIAAIVAAQKKKKKPATAPSAED
jgi:hypothetical protein